MQVVSYNQELAENIPQDHKVIFFIDIFEGQCPDKKNVSFIRKSKYKKINRNLNHANDNLFPFY